MCLGELTLFLRVDNVTTTRQVGPTYKEIYQLA